VSNAVVPNAGKKNIIVGNQSSLLPADPDALNALGAGIRASFPILSIDGKAWTARYEGREQILADNRGNPIPEIEVVILEAPGHTSKLYYDNAKGPYVPKSGRPPDCYSSDGVLPDKSVPVPVSPTCGACPKNELGSRIYNGKRLKACADQKRLVVVPAADILNEVWGGPMLLRVPGGSLKSLRLYSEDLAQAKLYFYGCTTIMRFEPGVSHQKLLFEYGRPLQDDEIRSVLTLRSSGVIRRILTEEPAANDPEAVGGSVEESGGEEVQQTPPPPAQPREVQPIPVQSTVVQGGFGSPPPPSPYAPQKPAGGIPPQPARGIPATPTKAAQTPSQPQQPGARAVGTGFGQSPPVKPSTIQATAKAVPIIRNTGVDSEIGVAINTPAAPPPSVRQMVPPPAPNDMEAQASQEEVGVGLPAEIQNIFGSLMGKK
jgi:hypothetical protein